MKNKKIALSILATVGVLGLVGGIHLTNRSLKSNEAIVVQNEYNEDASDLLSDETLFEVNVPRFNSVVSNTEDALIKTRNYASLLSSSMRVQKGLNSNNEECMRFVIAVPNINLDVYFVRTLTKEDGTTSTKKITATKAYTGVKSGDDILYPSDFNSDYEGANYKYFYCYTMSNITEEDAILEVNAVVFDTDAINDITSFCTYNKASLNGLDDKTSFAEKYEYDSYHNGSNNQVYYKDDKFIYSYNKTANSVNILHIIDPNPNEDLVIPSSICVKDFNVYEEINVTSIFIDENTFYAFKDIHITGGLKQFYFYDFGKHNIYYSGTKEDAFDIEFYTSNCFDGVLYCSDGNLGFNELGYYDTVSLGEETRRIYSYTEDGEIKRYERLTIEDGVITRGDFYVKDDDSYTRTGYHLYSYEENSYEYSVYYIDGDSSVFANTEKMIIDSLNSKIIVVTISNGYQYKAELSFDTVNKALSIEKFIYIDGEYIPDGMESITYSKERICKDSSYSEGDRTLEEYDYYYRKTLEKYYEYDEDTKDRILSYQYEYSYGANNEFFMMACEEYDDGSISAIDNTKSYYDTYGNVNRIFTINNKNNTYTVYGYDIWNNLVLEEKYTYDEDLEDYAFQSKKICQWNSKKQKNLEISYTKDSETGNLIPSTKTEYTYDGTTVISEMYTWISYISEYMLSSKNETCYYENGNINYDVTYRVSGGVATKNTKIEYIYQDGIVTGSNIYMWINDEWVKL